MIFSNISTFVKFLIKILPEISLVGSLFTNNPDITANSAVLPASYGVRLVS